MQKLLNLLFPVESRFGSFETYLDFQKYQTNPHILSGNQNIDQIIVGDYYKFSPLATLIPRAKYGLEYDIARILSEVIERAIAKLEVNLSVNSVLVPIPADPKRKLIRGFHLPEIIAKDLAHRLDLPVFNYLTKTISTKSQTSLSRKARLHNLKNKFALNPNLSKQDLLKSRNLILVDDLTTTGTTLDQAALTLRKIYTQNQLEIPKIQSLVSASDAG